MASTPQVSAPPAANISQLVSSALTSIGNLSGSHGKPGQRQLRNRSFVLRRPRRPVCARWSFVTSRRASRVSGIRIGCLGQAFRNTPARPNFIRFREIRSGDRHAVSTPGDLAVSHPRQAAWICASNWPRKSWTRLGGAVTAVDEVHGFRYFDDRDLLGFVDGTENPTGEDGRLTRRRRRRRRAVRRRQLRHRAEVSSRPEAWNALPARRRNGSSAARKLSDMELNDAVKPTYAHNALTNYRGERKRDARSCGTTCLSDVRARANSAPTLSATAASPRTTEHDAGEHVRRPAAGKLRPASRLQPRRDRAACSSSHRRLSRQCYCRTPGLPAEVRDACRPHRPQPALDAPSRRRQSLGIGSLKGETDMNNLHRELAPISDAAWAQIEEETSRTLKRHLAGAARRGRSWPGRYRSRGRRHRPLEADRRLRGGHPRADSAK